MYKVSDVCRLVIDYSNEMNYGISNLKLQKILYLIQAYFLSKSSHGCFDERIEAWDFGPVVPKAYREYKQYGGGNIPSTHYPVKPEHRIRRLFSVGKDKTYSISEDDQERIKQVIDAFSDYTAADLVRLTHNQRPWKSAYALGRNSEIKVNDIAEYFNAGNK